MAYTSWSVIHGEQPSATKWNLLGSNDAHFYSFLGANEAWTSFTPSNTNLTLGAGTNLARYKQVGNIITVQHKWTFGAGSAVGASPTLGLPFSGRSVAATTTIGDGMAIFFDTSASAQYVGSVRSGSLVYSSVLPAAIITSGDYGGLSGLSSTIPFTWASGDIIFTSIIYEAA